MSYKYVKWDVEQRLVLEVSHLLPGLYTSDAFIFYREPDEDDDMWFAYAGKTGMGRMLSPDQVPAEVNLAIELSR